jgi:transcriptional regulator with XRE-family HTH domain
MDKEIIGKRLRRQREKMSLTRDQLAEQIGISPQFLAEIENGSKGMSAETLYKMCKRVNLSADYMLLGRQSASDLQTPAVEMLRQIPPQYAEMVENILEAFLETVKMAECKDE